MALELVDLDEAEFTAERRSMLDDYAGELSAAFGTTTAASRAASEAQLPAFGAPGHLVRKAVLDGERVGLIWTALPGVFFPGMAWLSQIEVDEKHRGQGLGTRMIAAAEQDLAALGIHRVGLHVFGHNTGARRLYARLGYTLLNQMRSSRTPLSPLTPQRAAPPGARDARTPPSGLTPERPASPGARDARPAPAALAAGAPAVDLVPVDPAERERHLTHLTGNDPAALTHDPDASPDRVREVAEALGPTGEFRAVHAAGHTVGWVWFAEPDAFFPAISMVRYLFIAPAERRHGYGRATLSALSTELAARFALNIPGSHTSALAFADALGLDVVSQQMVKDLP
jgi:mycothiol synthase